VDYDASAIGYRIAETEVSNSTPGMYAISDFKRDVPKAMWVRDPKVLIGVEGNRVASQASLMAASYKRNIGIPANRGMVDLDMSPDVYVDKIIRACYRDDWMSVVDKHLDSGLWEANLADIDNFLANQDEKKMKKLMNSYFEEGQVDLTNWLLMAKNKIKAGRDVGGSHSVSHAQTILFQGDPGTNAMYSAMLRRFKEVTDECLRPEISLNTQRNSADHEAWYNTLEPIRKTHSKTFSYSVDIKTYDRSQDNVCLRFQAAWYKRHGLNPERLAIWEEMHGPKRAMSMMFSVIFIMTQGGVSGVFDTLYRNGIINLAAVVVSANLRREDIVMMDIKGDDFDGEFSRTLQVETTVNCMAKEFNLSAKFMTADVRYMCKDFRVRVNGVWYFVADPWSKVQSLCTPIRLTETDADLNERYVSFRDGLRHYDNGVLVDLVAEAAQLYYGTVKPLYGFARALAVFKAGNRHTYVDFFKPPRRVD